MSCIAVPGATTCRRATRVTRGIGPSLARPSDRSQEPNDLLRVARLLHSSSRRYSGPQRMRRRGGGRADPRRSAALHDPEREQMTVQSPSRRPDRFCLPSDGGLKAVFDSYRPSVSRGRVAVGLCRGRCISDRLGCPSSRLPPRWIKQLSQDALQTSFCNASRSPRRV